MPIIRKDATVDRWVIISPERNQRPSDFDEVAKVQPPKICPFCPGQEMMTPHEVLAYRPSDSLANSPGWTVRVVPNRYPALRLTEVFLRTSAGDQTVMSGVGAHEVVIETPVHHASLATLPLTHVESVLLAFQDRLQRLRQDERLCSALIFKNHGAAAGASLAHPHSQLIGLPIIPKALQDELHGATQYFQAHGGCILCDLVERELQARCRVVLDHMAFAALAPFASRCPFEIWIIPKRHDAWFESDRGEGYRHLAEVFQEIVRRLNVVLDDPAYNVILHTAPWIDTHSQCYHWHVEILPRLTGIAGFEWGTGWYMNSTSPEEAAGALRGAAIVVGD